MRSVLPSGCEKKTSPCGAIGTGDSVNLGGYGVELALKNMEYKAMDDSAIKKGTVACVLARLIVQWVKEMDVMHFIYHKILCCRCLTLPNHNFFPTV